MPKTNLTEIIALLDRSGSMAGIAADVCGGFNALIKDQKSAPGECNVTVVQFDSGGIDTVLENTPVDKVPPLTLEPRGTTPLLDAIGETIDRVGKRLAATDESQRPEKVVFVIMTDGYENASHQYDRPKIRQLIEQQTAQWKWQFSYIGANVDAFAEAAQIGIPAAAAASFAPNTLGVQHAYGSLSSNVRSLRSGTGGSSPMSYSSVQRKSMGGLNANQAPPVDPKAVNPLDPNAVPPKDPTQP